MWNFVDIVCWGCVMLEMWDVPDVGCSGCEMLEMRDVGDVGCSGCGMFGMWDVRDVGCGMWDVDLQNAVLNREMLYLTLFVFSTHDIHYFHGAVFILLEILPKGVFRCTCYFNINYLFL